MIVVAIIGILASVAVPYYQKYIAKSRLASKVFPGIHTIETNMASYYAFQPTLPFPTGATFDLLVGDANTQYFNVTPFGSTLTFVIQAPTGTNPLYALRNQTLTAHPFTADGKIVGWQIGGSLATNLGLSGEN